VSRVEHTPVVDPGYLANLQRPVDPTAEPEVSSSASLASDANEQNSASSLRAGWRSSSLCGPKAFDATASSYA